MSNLFLYLGPGMSGGFIALVVAVILSFVGFLLAVLYYPFKKIISFIKKRIKR